MPLVQTGVIEGVGVKCCGEWWGWGGCRNRCGIPDPHVIQEVTWGGAEEGTSAQQTEEDKHNI
eukprot:767491-Hanusia_phi.AAC.1